MAQILQFDEEIQNDIKSIAQGVTSNIKEAITAIDDIFRTKTNETKYKVFGDEGNQFIEFFNNKFNELLVAKKDEEFDPEIVRLTNSIRGAEALNEEAKTFSENLVETTIEELKFSFEEIDVTNLNSIKLQEKDFDDISNVIKTKTDEMFNYLDNESKKVIDLTEENPYFSSLQTLIEILAGIVKQGLGGLDSRIGVKLKDLVTGNINTTVSRITAEREDKIKEVREKAATIKDELYDELDDLFGDLEL